MMIITENAVARLKELGKSLRIEVLGGGCAGFQYLFTFDGNVQDNDVVFEQNGTCVRVDDISLAFLQGCQLDYKDELIGARFTIENPNATQSCGCGNSFAV